ncbi:MAG TPA: peptidylprolyl isomerase [Vicinamibacterales bacterium]|nr:peptidylprolyl isomerase [Vicinamibacterales bacterium]
MTRLFSALLISAVVMASLGCRKAASDNAATGNPEKPAATSGQTAAQPAPPTKPMPAELPDVLARVNGEAVTRVDFDRLIKNMELRANQPVPAERRDEVYRKALDQLVTYTVLSQETRARKVDVTDAEVDSGIQQMRGQFQTEEAFKKALESRGMTLDKLKADTRIDISINKMVEAEVSTQPPPTDAQVREFYDKNPDKFKQDEAVRASHILFRVEEAADAATKKKAMDEAQSVLKQARAGADFAELAKKHSADGSAQQGGDLNFFTRGQMVPPFDQAAFAMKPGEISEIVTTQFGYHIIKVTERRPASTVPFEQVSGRIKEFLTEQQKQQKADAFIQSLKQKAKIEVLV